MGSGSIVNEVQSVYDDFGQLVTEYQEHGGAVNTGTSLKVHYAYANGSSSTIRLMKMTYPNGRELNYGYGSAGSTDDALSRVASLIDDDGSTHLVDYSYLGRNTFVKTDYPEPDLRYDLAMGAGDDPYDGFDRFGRIVDSRWYDYGSSADVDRILYGYDRHGNRTFRERTCDPNSHHDEVYGYDSVNRLTGFDRGTITGNKDAISTLKFAQQWSLDPTGNWSAFKEDDDGDASWDLEQTRTSNTVNEITNITETSGPSWATPGYNRAGNMTTIPKPADPTSSFAATYDAWSRLVKLEEGEDTISEYVYDAAKRRVVQKTYDSGDLDETRHFHYTDPQKWQVIEERLESSSTISANPDRQLVWGLRYIDDLVLRDRDTDSNGSLDERLYALQDANWNVTALADSAGSVQERYAYSANGTPNVLTSTFTTRASSSYDIEVLYAGYRYEQATRVYHIRHRVYQPELGCWVQRDPIGYEARDSNLHRYVGASPPNDTDASGAWGSDIHYTKTYIHYTKTYQWSYRFFYRVAAQWIGEGDRAVDDSPFTSPLVPWGWSYHFDIPTPPSSVLRAFDSDSRGRHYRFWHVVSRGNIERPQHYEHIGSSCILAFIYLGHALHPLQDYYAHGNWKPSYWQGRQQGIHPMWYDNPSRTSSLPSMIPIRAIDDRGSRGRPGYDRIGWTRSHTYSALRRWIGEIWYAPCTCLCYLRRSYRPIRCGGTASSPPRQLPIPEIAQTGYGV